MRSVSIGFLMLVLLIGAAFPVGDALQAQEPAKKPDVEAPAARPQLGQPGSQTELESFSRLQAESDFSAKKALIEEFLKTYPDSGLVPLVHREASVLGMQANDFEMMTSHGEKALAGMAGDFALMTELARAYGERGVIEKAEEMAQSALEILNTAEKPPQATEAQWQEGKKLLAATNFSTLGYACVRRAQSATDPVKKRAEAQRAIAPFRKAIELNPGDDVSYWRVGFAYILLNDYANAESSLARAAVLEGIASGYAKKDLEDIYKSQHKGSLEGLDGIMAKAKKDLGLP